MAGKDSSPGKQNFWMYETAHRLNIKHKSKCFLELWLGNLLWSMNKSMSLSRDTPRHEWCQRFQSQCLCWTRDCYLTCQGKGDVSLCAQRNHCSQGTIKPWCWDIEMLNDCDLPLEQHHDGWLETPLKSREAKSYRGLSSKNGWAIHSYLSNVKHSGGIEIISMTSLERKISWWRKHVKIPTVIKARVL